MKKVEVLTEETKPLYEAERILLAESIEEPMEYVVADLHGNYRGLMQVLEEVGFNYHMDKLYQTGDILDGYPDAALIVDELLKMDSCISTMGNHDVWINMWLRKDIIPRCWTLGKDTCREYSKYLEASEEVGLWYDHSRFFSGQKMYHITDDKQVFVHGGWRTIKGISFEETSNNYIWDRSLWEDTLRAKGRAQPKILKRYSDVFVGHTPTLKWGVETPMRSHNMWNLDTGAGFKDGRVTIMDVNTKEFWQSDKSEKLYPDHNGRGYYKKKRFKL